MINLSTAPRKIKGLLVLCLIGTIISIGTIFWVYLATRNVVQSVGIESVPSIVAAKNIRATLANAHSNAMNAMVTKEKLGGKFWNLYREDMGKLHSQLIDASKNISYGDAERIPLLTILSNISAYEFTVGGAVANGAEISVDQFMEANRLMQQKILPASSALNQVNLSQLDLTYDSYTKNVANVMLVMYVVGCAFLIVLVFTQIYLFRRTHRVFNIGLLLATILFSASLVYSTSTMNSVKANLHSAKQEAFNSLNALWSARAEGYNAKSMVSLYLLHQGTGIVQTADTINFNLSSERLCSDPKAALAGSKFEGYLSEELGNITFQGEQAAAEAAIQSWVKYVDIDKQVRNLEYDSKHKEAVALSTGDSSGQSNYEFARFDAALGDAIKINQLNFDTNINTAFKTLSIFPFVAVAFLVAIIFVCIMGLKARMDEYRA